MRKKSAVAALGGAVMALVVFGSAVAFGGITNGSFENGTDPGGGWISLPAGTTGLFGWTVDAEVEYIGALWPAADGNRSLDMSASPSAGAISQDLATSAGATYDVTFALSANPACESGPKVLRVAASGASPSDFTYDSATEGNTLVNMKWRDETYSFVATGSVTTLSLASLTFGNCGPALDNVRVVESAPPAPPTPNTASDCKMGGWQGLTDHLGNGFKNQGDCVSYVATAGKNLGGGTP